MLFIFILGMTVLFQLGTREYDYVINCFPVINQLLTDFKTLIERDDIIKYIFGGNNDVLWMKRDFLIQCRFDEGRSTNAAGAQQALIVRLGVHPDNE